MSTRTATPETHALLDILRARTSLRAPSLQKELGEAIAVVDGLILEATAIENAVRALRYAPEDPDLKGELRLWENSAGSLMSLSRDLRKLTDQLLDKVHAMDTIELAHERIIEEFEATPDEDVRMLISRVRSAS